MTDRTISHCNLNAAHYQKQYDALPASDVHADCSRLLIQLTPGQALDVGAGSGRDALWLARQGWRVTAVEPAAGLRRLGQQTTASLVEWVDAQLPALAALPLPEQGFDLILLSAVWMHLRPEQRPAAFQRLHECLSPEGVMIITLRFGPSDPDRPMYAVSVEELKNFAEQYALELEELSQGFTNDFMQRSDVHWKTLCLRRAGECA